jgi:hypothetical protein
MLQISRVDVVDDWTLDIELNNGHLILFDTRRLMETDSTYDVLRNSEVLPRPSTDGSCIFWREGLRITLNEIMIWLNRQDNKEE